MKCNIHCIGCVTLLVCLLDGLSLNLFVSDNWGCVDRWVAYGLIRMFVSEDCFCVFISDVKGLLRVGYLFIEADWPKRTACWKCITAVSPHTLFVCSMGAFKMFISHFLFSFLCAPACFNIYLCWDQTPKLANFIYNLTLWPDEQKQKGFNTSHLTV